MNADRHPDMLRRHDSPDEPTTANASAPHASAASANAKISDDGRYVPLLVLLAVLAGGALVLALMAHREASIATMRVEGMTRALIAHGIKDTYPHLPGEDD